MKKSDLVTLLLSYSVCEKFIRSQEYAQDFFNPYDTQKVSKREQYEARMNAVESLIQLLEPSDEYTLLHLHYIKGIPVEKCAESMFISRSTAFRMLKRAHEQILNLVNKGADNEQREAD